MEDDEAPESGMDASFMLGGSDPASALSALAERYTRSLEGEAAARRQVEASRADRYRQAEEAIKRQRFGAPSTSERLFALSAALLSPRPYRGFAGTLANVVPALAQNAAAQRKAEEQREAALRQLREQYGEATDASRLAAIAGEREGLGKLLSVYGPLAKPRVPRPVGTQVVDGKIVAVSQDPNTGEFSTTPIGSAPKKLTPVSGVRASGQQVFTNERGELVTASGDLVTQTDEPIKKPSATETRRIFDIEDNIEQGMGAISALQDALSLNQQAFEGSLTGFRTGLGKLFASDDPAYIATERYDNLIKSGALESLRSTFGGNPTEGERKVLLELQASSSKPRPVREAILRRALDLAQKRLERNRKRLEALKGGSYSSYETSTPTRPSKKPRVINWGE